MSTTETQWWTSLPQVIPCCSYEPSGNAVGGWEAVDAEPVADWQELPAWLFMGLIDPEAFESSSKAWTAVWKSNETGGEFTLKYERGRPSINWCQKWQGIEGSSGFAPTSAGLPSALNYVYAYGGVGHWETAAKELLEAKHEVIFQPNGTPDSESQQAVVIASVPDGCPYQFMIPVTARDIPNVVRAFRHLATGSSYPFLWSASARLAFQAVNYIEGKSEVASNPRALLEESVNATGFFPVERPVREEATDGSAAWTVRSLLYYCYVTVPFPYVLHFADQLSQSGLIKQSGSAVVPAMTPLVIPVGLYLEADHLAYPVVDGAAHLHLFPRKCDPNPAMGLAQAYEAMRLPETEQDALADRARELSTQHMAAMSEA